MVDCVQHEFHPRRNAQLVEDPEQVFLDRMLAELEFHGDLSIGQALGNQSDNLLLARSEKLIPVRVEHTQRWDFRN